MQPIPLRNTVIGSYPFPAWLEHAVSNLNAFGSDDIEELQNDACTIAVQDQLRAGLDVITELCQRLLDGGAPGLHFYTMNQSGPTTEIWRRLGLDKN